MKLTMEQKQELVTRYYNGDTITDICKESGVSRSAFYSWITPYRTTTTDAGYIVSAAEFVKMKKALEKLEQKIEVLQTVKCMVSSPLKRKLYELETLHGNTVSMCFAKHFKLTGVLSIIICSVTKRIRAAINFAEMS